MNALPQFKKGNFCVAHLKYIFLCRQYSKTIFCCKVIVNNYLNRIERLNEELVNLLLEKDELQVHGLQVFY
jgi:hypothetical protein